MEKEDYHQLELFSQTKNYEHIKTKGSNAFSNFIRTYEKSILIITGFIITGVLSFSLGVERGKRIILRTNLQLDVASKEKTSTSISQISHQTINEQEVQKTRKKIEEPVSARSAKYEVKEQIQNYTIQIASFRTKTYAQKEVERLKKRGYSPIILPKGSFSIVCVGNFPKQELARALLTELKKLYLDSYIRRL